MSSAIEMGFRDYTFRCNATADDNTAQTQTVHLWSPQESEMAGTSRPLDFAWNNERVQFNTSADTTTATGTFIPNTDFNYRGNANQLRNEWSQFSDIENTPFDMVVTGTRRFLTGTSGELSKEGKIKQALMQIFKEPDKEILKEMDNDDKKMLEAKRKSEKLLKSWLSKAEYDGLVMQGQIEIPSKEDDVIFIVKRDPNEMVDVKKHGRFSHKLCAVAEDLVYPVGDQLLSKIVLIKTDEDKFKKIAIKHG